MTMGRLKLANNTIALTLVVVLIVLGWVVPFGNAAELRAVRGGGAIKEQDNNAAEKDSAVTQASNYEGFFPRNRVPYQIVEDDDKGRSLQQNEDSKPFYIMCYGDQVTSGLIDYQSGDHPYARRMKQLLKSLGLRNTVVSFTGLVGWTSLAMEQYRTSPDWGLVGLIRGHINKHGRPPHLVILNAGFNDMWRVNKPGEIFQRLKALTEEALKLGVEKVIILDLQPSVLRQRHPQKDRWAWLINRLKTQYAKETPNVVGAAFPFEYVDSKMDMFSEDGLNLSDLGHKALGSALAPIVQSHLLFGGHVFCYGDSLTAGVNEGGDMELTPYAPYLEEALTGSISVFKLLGKVVDWVGLPGYTAGRMIRNLDDEKFGLRTWIELSPKDIDVLIIMAGTNDVLKGRKAPEIAADIIALHEAALAYDKVRFTISIDVPPSRDFQTNMEMNAIVREVNNEVGQWVEGNPRVQRFMFPFIYESGSKNFASDQLHFSRQGYKKLGQDLAPVVRDLARRKKEEK